MHRGISVAGSAGSLPKAHFWTFSGPQDTSLLLDQASCVKALFRNIIWGFSLNYSGVAPPSPTFHERWLALDRSRHRPHKGGGVVPESPRTPTPPFWRLEFDQSSDQSVWALASLLGTEFQKKSLHTQQLAQNALSLLCQKTIRHSEVGKEWEPWHFL